MSLGTFKRRVDELMSFVDGRSRPIFWVVLGVGTLLRLGAVLVLDEPNGSDQLTYINGGINLATRGDMGRVDGNVAFYAPGYSLWLGLIFKLFGTSLLAAQFANVALSILAIHLVYASGKILFRNEAQALLAMAAFAVYLPSIVYTEYLLKETLAGTLVMAIVVSCLLYMTTNWRKLLSTALGVTFGLTLLVVPAAMLLGIGILMAIMVVGEYWSQRLRDVMIFALAATLVLAPWLAYTHDRLGHAILSSNGGFNFYLGHNPAADGWFKGIEHTPMKDEWHRALADKGEVVASDMLRKAGIDWVLSNPVQAMLLDLRKLAYFWYPPVHEAKDGNRSIRESAVRSVWLVQYILIILLAALSLSNFRILSNRYFAVLIAIFLYWVIHAGAFVTFRFREPIMPLVILLATLGFAQLLLGRKALRQ